MWCRVSITVLLACQGWAFPTSDEAGELVSLLVVYRHGDRGPVYLFPNDPYSAPQYWPQGYGQLTTHGVQRQYELGQWLRNRYNNFLPEIYSPEDLFVYSTNVDRTLMSASANLAGLYPPKSYQVWNPYLMWQPVPIHTTFNGSYDIFPDTDDCPKYKKDYKKVKKNDYFKGVNKKYEYLFAELSKKVGSEIDDIKGIRQVRDVIYVYENYNKSYIPTWAWDLDRSVLDNATAIYFKRKSYTDNLIKYLAGPFLNTLSSHFEEAVSTKTNKKFFMVSSHESYLVPVLNALGAYDFYPPDFAATIIFELRKIQDSYFVQVLYKQFNGLKTLNVAECGTLCEFSHFKKAISKYSLTFDEWQKVCGKDDDSKYGQLHADDDE